MIYAIGDIHGMFDKLKRLYSLILLDITSKGYEENTIVFLGDYVDRGPDSKDVLDFLMGLTDTENITHIFLKGNHEQMMIDCYNNFSQNAVRMYLVNGGYETLLSFDCATQESFCGNDRFKPYIDWVNDLPAIFIEGPYAFVHGGYDPNFPPSQQREEVLLWKRTNDYNRFIAYRDCDYIVVHGHTPHREYQIFPNEINVDTAACFPDGKLTAAVLPDISYPKSENNMVRVRDELYFIQV